MTARELAFMRSAARGLRLAQVHLSSPDRRKYMAQAVEVMADGQLGAISNRDIAYFAAMFNAWEDEGKPDLLT